MLLFYIYLLLFGDALSVEAATPYTKVVEKKHHVGQVYKPHDQVFVFANKVGPFNNPHETFSYYSMPFCKQMTSKAELSPNFDGIGGEKHSQALGLTLQGLKKEGAPYDITFMDNVPYRQLCETTLSSADVQKFKEGVHDSYYFEMLIEDLPMWGYLGEIEGEDIIMGEGENSRTYLYPHLHFTIGTNQNKIVKASVHTSEARKVDITDITSSMTVHFTYSVEWTFENLKHSDRHDTYVDNHFVPRQFNVQWLSIVNSVVLVFLLTALMAIILVRVLRNDFQNYLSSDAESGLDNSDESGWKLIHGDVFRFPQHKTIFCSVLGAGAHLCVATFVLLALALVGFVSTTKRGSVLTAVLVIYSLTGFVGGFVSSSLFKQMGGGNWVRTIVTTTLVFPVPLGAVFSWVNTVALTQNSTAALPFGTIMIIVCLFAFVCFPLTVCGGIIGRNLAGDFNAPVRTTKVAREIPEFAWYRYPPLQMLVSGFLPFSATYIEMHHIFESIWGHEIYTFFGILFLAFGLMAICCAFMTVCVIYYQLVCEDHRWWWKSFANGGSIGLFVYAYSIYFWFQHSAMDGMLQGSYFFGYMAVASYGFFLMLGSLGTFTTLKFVKYIYSQVKCD